MSRPAVERPGDALPTPDDFAGWPPLGALALRVAAGPVVADLVRLDARAREALLPFGDTASTEAGPAGALPMRLEWTRASRPAWLTLAPGDRARSVAWTEGGALAWATHHVALLMDSSAERGIVVMTDQSAEEASRSAQNVLRAAVAWRLAASGRGLLLHASAVRHAAGAVVFLGPSGAGKSTAARLSAPRPVLADDACVITADEGVAVLHPAPFWACADFPGRSDDRGPLRVAGIFRLAKAPRHAVRPLPGSVATAALAAHAPFLAGLSPALEATAVASRIAASARVAELELAPDPGFWDAIDNEISAGGRSASGTWSNA